VLTTGHLLDIIRKEPSIIHICCHGVANDRWSAYEKTTQDDRCLLFESNEGDSHLVSQKKLKELLQQEQEIIRNIDLVFLAACTSEVNGKIFKELGVKHVICI
jgi:CHAT domain-containing protein